MYSNAYLIVVVVSSNVVEANLPGITTEKAIAAQGSYQGTIRARSYDVQAGETVWQLAV